MDEFDLPAGDDVTGESLDAFAPAVPAEPMGLDAPCFAKGAVPSSSFPLLSRRERASVSPILGCHRGRIHSSSPPC